MKIQDNDKSVILIVQLYNNETNDDNKRDAKWVLQAIL